MAAEKGWKRDDSKPILMAVARSIPMALIRGVLGAALVGITFGGYPAKWWSAALAVALCIVAAFALHFAVPIAINHRGHFPN